MLRIKLSLASLAGLALLSGGAQAASVSVIVGTNAAANYHTSYLAGGSNGLSLNPTYGDGATSGISPNNMCIDGIANPAGTNPGGTDPLTGLVRPANTPIAAQLCSNPNIGVTPLIAANQFVNGSNGAYWTGINAAPVANYAGSTITYDNAITFVDPVDGFTYYRVTGGALGWAGSYGFEVSVGVSATSGRPGGSFFGYAFNNGTVNLATGARTGTSSCFLGAGGNEVVGALLCAVQPITSYAYASSGTVYTKSANWAGIRFDGLGGSHLILTSDRFTQSGGGNNLREELNLQIIPVPAAVWLFGSAVGLMGALRRRKAAV